MTGRYSTSFKDHFSAAAPHYAAFRPHYPLELAGFLATLPSQRDLAWDSGCGSGQLSTLLGRHFQRVEATDASAAQIAGAEAHPRVSYRVAKSEASELTDRCVDLAVCAQAAHWYDLDAYYREVRRVCRDGAAVALVTYGRNVLDSDVNAIVDDFYDRVAGPYWPPERRIVEDGYRNLPFPFREITAPSIDMTADWTLPQLLGYVDTWSAMRGMEKAGGRESYEQFCRDMTVAWGKPGHPRRVTWPLAMRVGYV